MIKSIAIAIAVAPLNLALRRYARRHNLPIK